MTTLVIGDVTFRLAAVEAGGRWVARATRADTGQPFGIDVSGATEADALSALSTWLTWQREHAAALTALLNAERTFHRVVAENAFAQAGDGSTSAARKESIEAVEEARTKLDAIRARRP